MLLKAKHILQAGGLFFCAVLLTIIFTWPFAAKLNSFYLDIGDPAIGGFSFWHTQKAIKSGDIFNREKLFTTNQFYPYPNTMAYASHSVFCSFIFGPIFWLSNNLVLSTNLTNFLSFVFCFIASFWTINYFLKNKSASLVGAIIYTFNPLTFAHFPVHGYTHKFFLPLVFLFAYQFFKTPSFINSLKFFLVFTLNCLTDLYFQTLTITVLPFFILPFLWFNFSRRKYAYFIKLLGNSLLFIIFIPFLLHVNLNYLELSKNEIVVRSIQQTTYYSARLIDWFLSSPDNLIYGKLARSIEQYRKPGFDQILGRFNYEEHTLFVNFLPFLLFIAGCFFLYSKFRKKPLRRLFIYSFSILLFISFLFTFGPYFTGFNSNSAVIVTPYFYLRKILFFLQGIRAPTRFQFIFYVPFSIFCSFGCLWLFKKIKKESFRIILLFVLILILFLENFNQRKYSDTSAILRKTAKIKNESPVLDKLKNKAVLHLPIQEPSYGNESAYLNWATQTDELIVNGNSGYLSADQVIFFNSLKENLDEENLKKLKSIGVNYLIFHQDLSVDNFEKYKENLSYLEKAIIYNNNEIKIIDLDKLNLEIKKCDFEKDFSFQIFPLKKDYLVRINNNNDCYLVNAYQDRYREIDFFFNMQGVKVHLKMPVVIGPHQSYDFSPDYSNLKVISL